MGKPKLTIDFIRKEIVKYGFELLAEEYVNVNTPLEIKCFNGHESKKSWEKIKAGRGCKKCATNKQKNDFNNIKNEFTKRYYKLLSEEYINAHSKLQYICPEGHEGEISWHEFRRGEGCNKCSYDNRSGEKSTSWNPNLTDKERIRGRQYREIRRWKREVRQLDDNTCQCCENKNKIVTHHIINFTKNIDFRHDIRNGIVLCQECHLEFHHIHSKKNNNGEQLLAFILDKNNELDVGRINELKIRLIDTVNEMLHCHESLINKKYINNTYKMEWRP